MNIKIIIALVGFSVGMLVMYIAILYTPVLNNLRAQNSSEYLSKPTYDVIPDEETALRVTEAIFDTYFSEDNRTKYLTTDQYKKDNKLQVRFSKDTNTWNVYYLPETAETYVGGGAQIALRKDNGMVVHIGLSQ